MKRIAYLMIVFGLVIFISAILNTKTDWVQVMFGSFLCVGGYFTLKEKGLPLIKDHNSKNKPRSIWSLKSDQLP